MNYLLQIAITLGILVVVTKLLKLSFLGFLLLVSVPIIYFYPFSILTLALSLLLAFTLKKLLTQKTNYANMIIFTVILIFAVLVSGHKIYSDIAIENVTNSQRGEHPNFRTSILAKVLHNKTTTIIYYLQNLNDRLSISTIFASGSYPNLSKYLPLGFLFPWYLIGFLISIRRRYKDYLNYVFLIALSVLLFLISVFSESSTPVFMFSVIWFICFESVEQIAKFPAKLSYLIFSLNLVYLGIFFLSYKAFLI